MALVHQPIDAAVRISHVHFKVAELERALDFYCDALGFDGVSEALYLRDPDGNGVELYWDPPQSEWPRTPDSGIAMFSHALDLDTLLREE